VAAVLRQPIKTEQAAQLILAVVAVVVDFHLEVVLAPVDLAALAWSLYAGHSDDIL
jgi:hypothetical protein